MKKLYIIKNSKIEGKGMFAAEDIPKGTTIIEYLGEKITNEEADKREIENDKTGRTYIFYLDDKYSLDGAVGGNDSIFVNHSCEPNCNYVYKKGRIFYEAKRDIKKGEELTIDYEFDYEEPLTPCFCGSKNCRGTINKK